MRRRLAILFVVSLGLLTACSDTVSGPGSTGATGTAAHGTLAPGVPSVSSSSAAPGSGLIGCTVGSTTCNSADVRSGGTLTYAIGYDVLGWYDPLSATTELDAILAGVLPSAFVVAPDLTATRNDALLTSGTVTSTSPQVVVYDIAAKAVWNDGVPITADDFVYSWQANKPFFGYQWVSGVVGSNGGRRVTVTFSRPYAEWRSLFALVYPAHIAKLHGDAVAQRTWFDEHPPTYSGGPFEVADYATGHQVVLRRNPRWYGPAAKLDAVDFRIYPTPFEQIEAVRNGEAQVARIDPSDSATVVAARTSKVDVALTTGELWEHVDLNLKSPLLADTTLRRAILTAFDRSRLIAAGGERYLPSALPLGSRVLLPDQPGYEDTVLGSGQGSGDLDGARHLLSVARYTGVGTALRTPAGKPVSMRCVWTNPVRRQVCQIIQSELGTLGIKVVVLNSSSLVRRCGPGLGTSSSTAG